MKKTNKLTLTAAAAITVALLFQTPLRLFGDASQPGSDATGDDHSGRLSLTFNKCQTSPGILQGTVDGDCGPGTIYFMALPGRITGASVVQFAGEYTITTSQCSFKAVCAGTRCIS